MKNKYTLYCEDSNSIFPKLNGKINLNKEYSKRLDILKSNLNILNPYIFNKNLSNKRKLTSKNLPKYKSSSLLNLVKSKNYNSMKVSKNITKENSCIIQDNINTILPLTTKQERKKNKLYFDRIDILKNKNNKLYENIKQKENLSCENSPGINKTSINNYKMLTCLRKNNIIKFKEDLGNKNLENNINKKLPKIKETKKMNNNVDYNMSHPHLNLEDVTTLNNSNFSNKKFKRMSLMSQNISSTDINIDNKLEKINRSENLIEFLNNLKPNQEESDIDSSSLYNFPVILKRDTNKTLSTYHTKINSNDDLYTMERANDFNKRFNKDLLSNLYIEKNGKKKLKNFNILTEYFNNKVKDLKGKNDKFSKKIQKKINRLKFNDFVVGAKIKYIQYKYVYSDYQKYSIEPEVFSHKEKEEIERRKTYYQKLEEMVQSIRNSEVNKNLENIKKEYGFEINGNIVKMKDYNPEIKVPKNTKLIRNKINERIQREKFEFKKINKILDECNQSASSLKKSKK